MKHRRPPRIPGFDYIGEHAYSVTLCTRARRKWFEQVSVVGAVRKQLLRTAEEYGFAIIVYCFMPDHVHLVVEGRRGDADFRRFVKVFKQRAVHHTRALRKESLWQEGYYEHVIRGEETTTQAARYVLDNPVRAELVKNPEEYPSADPACTVFTTFLWAWFEDGCAALQMWSNPSGSHRRA